MLVQPLGRLPAVAGNEPTPAQTPKGLSDKKLDSTSPDSGEAPAPPVDQVELSDVARKLGVLEHLAGGGKNAELQLSPSNLRKLAKGQVPE